MNSKIISKFQCNNSKMVVVRLKNCAHVMTVEEWQKVYGKLHPERWKDGKIVCRNEKMEKLV